MCEPYTVVRSKLNTNSEAVVASPRMALQSGRRSWAGAHGYCTPLLPANFQNLTINFPTFKPQIVLYISYLTLLYIDRTIKGL